MQISSAQRGSNAATPTPWKMANGNVGKCVPFSFSSELEFPLIDETISFPIFSFFSFFFCLQVSAGPDGTMEAKAKRISKVLLSIV